MWNFLTGKCLMIFEIKASVTVRESKQVAYLQGEQRKFDGFFSILNFYVLLGCAT